MEFFTKALRVNSKNIYAAHGIGIGFAELGKYDDAKDVLTEVQECSTTSLNVTFNLAHVLVELSQARTAIPLVIFEHIFTYFAIKYLIIPLVRVVVRKYLEKVCETRCGFA